MSDWTMPEWMRPFARFMFSEYYEGVKSVAEAESMASSNDAVHHHITLLERLHEAGLLLAPWRRSPPQEDEVPAYFLCLAPELAFPLGVHGVPLYCWKEPMIAGPGSMGGAPGEIMAQVPGMRQAKIARYIRPALWIRLPTVPLPAKVPK